MKKTINVYDLRAATIVHTGKMERTRESLLRALLLDREWKYMRDLQRAEENG